ncbi:MAG: DUF4270 family protein [Alistipes sp.]
MKRSSKLRCLLNTAAVVGVVTFLTFSGCTKVDDTLGSDFIPDNQDMKIGVRKDLKNIFETRLYYTDSLRTSNLGSGFFGSTCNDTFGLRSTGFFSQYRWTVIPSKEGFGYRPIFDSTQLFLAVSNYGGDTTYVQQFEVYEIKDNSFLAATPDTTFYGNFDISKYLEAEPAFTFEFPNQAKGVYAKSNVVTMQPTAQGRKLIDRLMLQKDGLSMTIFDDQSTWFNTFKGLYIKPKQDAAKAGDGNIFQINLSESGFVIYGRNRDKTDPTLIKDTTTSVYYFYHTNSETANLGNISINTMRHDYTKSKLAAFVPDKPNTSSAVLSDCYVEGLGGVVTAITFTDELFKELEKIVSEESKESGVRFKSMAFSQVTISFFGREGAYDWTTIQPTETFLDWLGSTSYRLGLYTSYKRLTGISDYNYLYEKAGNAITYGGYVNRSQGRYTMDIKSYIQQLWNSYLDKKAGKITEIPNRTIYLAPEAYSVNSFSYGTAQGAAEINNTAPMKLDITYVMIK